MAQIKTANSVNGKVQVTTTIATSAVERAVEVAEDLKEWLEDNGMKGWVVRRSIADVIVICTYRSGELHNGNLSALASAAAEIDRALSEITKFRWFADSRSVAKFLVGRDEAEEEPDDYEDEGEEEDGNA